MKAQSDYESLRPDVTLVKPTRAIKKPRIAGKVDAVPLRMLRRARRLAGNAMRVIDKSLFPPDFKPPFTQRDIRVWKRMPVHQQRAMLTPILKKYILKWDWLAESAGRDRADLPLIFTHMPKTAGMTLEAIISQNYYSYHLVHIDGPNAERNPAALFKQGVLPTVAMGHYEFNHILFLALHRPTAHITMLREPVRRVISYYNWVRRSEKHPLHEKLAKMTLREFAASSIGGGRLEASNGQALRIAGRIGKRFETDPRTYDESLELAKHHLLTTYSLFGVQEKFDEFLLMARSVLGWRDIYHRSRNQSVDGIKLKDVDEETLAIIRERNQMDAQLHEFASKIFDERCQQLGIGQENVERFRQANVEYQRLLDLDL